MFPSRVSVHLPATPETEDIFSTALSNLFTDDAQNSHGVPGQSVVYHSPRFGVIDLRIPAHPDVEEGRKLFAHYLWNAGVIAADAIEKASAAASANTHGRDGPSAGSDRHEKENDLQPNERWQWNGRHWDVRGRSILELGAGTALPSIISCLSGASSVTITDHPSSPALTTGVIRHNVDQNVFGRHLKRVTETPAMSDLVVDIFGYTWGTTTMYLPDQYGKPAPPTPAEHPDTAASFDRIIVADCLWMPSQHGNLVKTLLHHLTPPRHGPNGIGGSALVVAGFHTGREVVRQFFETATGEWKLEEDEEERDDEQDDADLEVRGRLKAAEIFEVDVDGRRRPWLPVRPGEDKDQAKRWSVCAVLVRR